MQSVTVRMYETYDMSTSQGKMGLIAIRTPRCRTSKKGILVS